MPTSPSRGEQQLQRGQRVGWWGRRGQPTAPGKEDTCGSHSREQANGEWDLTHTRQSEGNTKQDNGIYLNRRRRAMGMFVLGNMWRWDGALNRVHSFHWKTAKPSSEPAPLLTPGSMSCKAREAVREMVRVAHGKKTLRSESRGFEVPSCPDQLGFLLPRYTWLLTFDTHCPCSLVLVCRNIRGATLRTPWQNVSFSSAMMWKWAFFGSTGPQSAAPSSAPSCRHGFGRALLLAWRVGAFLAESLRSPCKNQKSFPSDMYIEPKRTNIWVTHVGGAFIFFQTSSIYIAPWVLYFRHLKKRVLKMLLPKRNKPGRNASRQLQGCSPLPLFFVSTCLLQVGLE